MNDAPSQNQDKYIVRLPNGMRDRIKAAAEKNNRSMNAEIVAVLSERFPEELVNYIDGGLRASLKPVDTELEDVMIRWLRKQGRL